MLYFISDFTCKVSPVKLTVFLTYTFTISQLPVQPGIEQTVQDVHLKAPLAWQPSNKDTSVITCNLTPANLKNALFYPARLSQNVLNFLIQTYTGDSQHGIHLPIALLEILYPGVEKSGSQ